MSALEPVIIAGGGIAGLSAAIALARQGFQVQIFEKAPQLSEQGAGLQLGPNATRILRQWGLEAALLAAACQPEAIELHDGANGRHLTCLPVGRLARDRWYAPYVTIHRSDLQNLLRQEVENHPLITLQCASEISDLAEMNRHHGCLFLACDGVWSRLRTNCCTGDGAQFSGFIAWRTTVDLASLPACWRSQNAPSQNAPSQNVCVSMGPNGHFISYPIRGGKACNLVAITRSKTADHANRHELLHAFKNWKSDRVNIITEVSDWTPWPIFVWRKPYFLSPEGIVFLGDSAHATTPFAAQGAAMAIEDAAELAKFLPNRAAISRRNLELFAIKRSVRVSKVARRGAFNRYVYHASGVIGACRNLYMRCRTPEKFLHELDWLYSP